MLISKSNNETESHKAEHLKAKKKVHRIFKGYLFNNFINKQEATVEVCTSRKYNLEKFKDITHLFLNKTLPHNAVDQIKTYLIEIKKPRALDSTTWIQRILQINKLIPIVGDKEKKYTDYKLIKKVIIINVSLEQTKSLIHLGFNKGIKTY